MAAARWFAVGFLALHVLLAAPASDVGEPGSRAGAWLVVALYALVCVGAEVGIRITRRRSGFERLGMALMVADVAVASAFVWLYRADPGSATWVVLTLLPLEGAVRFGLAGALAAWVGTLPSLVLPAVEASRATVDLADLILPPLFLLVLALIGGVVGRDLERQVVVLGRLNRAARRIASRREPEDVLATLCDEAVRVLDARSAAVVEERDGRRRVLWASPWREPGDAERLGTLEVSLPWATPEQSLWFVVDPARGSAALAPQVARALAESAAIAIASARVIEIEQRTNARLRYLEALRKRFVATIAHDLRLPLTVFKGVAHVLRARRDEIEPEEVDDLLASVERQANRLGRLADDLLDAARADAGRITIVRVPCALRAIAEQAAVDFNEPVEIEIDPDLEIMGDRSRLDRVVWNLLGNAQKYGRPPYQVQAMREGDVVELSVRDHGPGLPEEVRERLFEEFTAGDSEGVGLGLAIVRQLAEAHGGDVRYEDADPGARFIVTLPLDDPDEDAGGEEAGAE